MIDSFTFPAYIRMTGATTCRLAAAAGLNCPKKVLHIFESTSNVVVLSLMPHYSIFESHEPKLTEYESYHLTWYDDSYSNGGPYGEPIFPYHDDLYYDPSSVYPEEVDFTNRFWHEYGLSDQTYKDLPLQLPHYGDNSWLGEYGSYYDGHWKDEISSHGYGVSDNDYGLPGHSLEKAQDTYKGEEQYDSHYSYDDDTENPTAYGLNPWFGNGFMLEYGVGDESAREYEPLLNQYGSSHSHNVYDMRLCEMIFGYWPPLSTTNQESYVAEACA